MPEKRKRRNTPNSFSGKTTTWKLKPTSCFILLELTSWSAEGYSRSFQGGYKLGFEYRMINRSEALDVDTICRGPGTEQVWDAPGYQRKHGSRSRRSRETGRETRWGWPCPWTFPDLPHSGALLLQGHSCFFGQTQGPEPQG